MASGVMSKVAFVGKVPTLMKATSDDINPTPGYLFPEITKITFESLDYCDFMVEFLIERLKKKSLQVKLKVLIVIKHVLEKGHEEFAKCLRKKSDAISMCKDIHGPSDPMHGDRFYVDIRNTVNDVLNMLFNLDSRANSSVSNKPEERSFGSSQKMEGFGNTSTPSTNMFQSVVGKIKEAVPTNFFPTSAQKQHKDNFSSYKKFDDINTNTIEKPSDVIWGFGDNSHDKDHDLSSQGESVNTGISWKTSSTFLDSNKVTSMTQGNDMNWILPTNPSSMTNVPVMKKQGMDFHEVERRVVEEITLPQGMRQQPSKPELVQFTKKCSSLDLQFVVNLLNGKLNEADSRIKMRTLCAIEALITSDLPNITNLIRTCCSSSIQSFQDISHTQTRSKAQKILQLLDPKPPSTSLKMKNNLIEDFSIGSSQSENLSPLTPIRTDDLDLIRNNSFLSSVAPQDHSLLQHNQIIGSRPSSTLSSNELLLDVTPDDVPSGIEHFSFDMHSNAGPKLPYSSQIVNKKTRGAPNQTHVPSPQPTSTATKVEANLLDLDALTLAWDDQIERGRLHPKNLQSPSIKHASTDTSARSPGKNVYTGQTSNQQDLPTSSGNNTLFGLMHASLPPPPSYNQQTLQTQRKKHSCNNTITDKEDGFFTSFDKPTETKKSSSADETDLFAGLNIGSSSGNQNRTNLLDDIDTNIYSVNALVTPSTKEADSNSKSEDFGDFLTSNNTTTLTNNSVSNSLKTASYQSSSQPFQYPQQESSMKSLNNIQFSHNPNNSSFNLNSQYGFNNFNNTAQMSSQFSATQNQQQVLGNYANYGHMLVTSLPQQQQLQQHSNVPYQYQQASSMQNKQNCSGYVTNQSGYMASSQNSMLGFINQTHQQGKTADTFSFVQDAMKSSISKK